MSGASYTLVASLVLLSSAIGSTAESHAQHLRRESSVKHSVMQVPAWAAAGAPAGAPAGSPAALGKGPNATVVRPSSGKEADVIKFALFAKNFYGDDLKDSTFQIDVVVSLEWKDLRVVELIPAGLTNLTISSAIAEKLIWMPGVVVSNRDIDKYEVISSLVTLFENGDVVKVERVHVKVCEKFALIDYPFDTEYMRVVIASSKYMSDDVVLVPSTRAHSSGVDCPFGGYFVEGWNTSAFEELDGDLEKSRGMLNVKTVRKLEKYHQDHLVPTVITVCISCAVFYFPMVGPFVTPRLALSILALLTFTNLMVKSGDALPGPAPYNWNDLLNQQVQGIMFLVIVLNIFSEICWHSLDIEWLARRINHEAKVFIPLFSLLDILFVIVVGYNKLLTLRTATIAIQSVSFTFVGVYAVWVMVMLVAEKRTRKQGAEAPKLSHQASFSHIVRTASMTLD